MDPRLNEIEKAKTEIAILERKIIVLKGYIKFLEDEIKRESLVDTKEMEIINVNGTTN